MYNSKRWQFYLQNYNKHRLHNKFTNKKPQMIKHINIIIVFKTYCLPYKHLNWGVHTYESIHEYPINFNLDTSTR